MRLLRFNQSNSGNGPEQAAHVEVKLKDRPGPPATRAHPPRNPASTGKSAARVFPVQGANIRTPAQQGPIDLEKLQQRVKLLEKRISTRVENKRASLPAPELEALQQRLLKLERNINRELWAARQREHTLLEILARPPLSARIWQRMIRFKTHSLPAVGRWLKAASREWWQDRQPDWWPMFARAWQESLDKARDY